MKRMLMPVMACLLIIGCNPESQNQKTNQEATTSSALEQQDSAKFYGEAFDSEQYISVDALEAQLSEQDSVMTQVKGKVLEVCQAKGCWMTIAISEQEHMRVSFKDYGFFVPKDLSGKTVVMKGKAKVSTTDVATLKHLAADAGKSEEEINQIMEEEESLQFRAEGVTVID